MIVGIINMAILQAMAIILLEITTTQHKWQQVVYRIFRVLLSPMVVLPITGMLVSHFNIAIPKFIITTTQNIASPISGLSLFTFGLSISNGLTIKREHITHDFISAIVIKSLIHPVVAGLIGYFIFNLSRYWLASTIILTAAPTALVVSFIAKQYDLDSLFVRRVIVVQSVISLVTIIPIFIFMM